MTSGRQRTRITAIMLIYALCAVAFSAWISDDAMITLRQVDMFVDGQGIVWNPGYRVQAFTHPAWFWLLSAGHALTGSLHYMTIAASAVCALAALWLYARHVWAHVDDRVFAAAFLFLPLASRAFVDYLASGLENPLSFLLVALVFTLLAAPASARRDRALWVVLALAVLTRQDHALQLGPLALWLFVSRGPLVQLRRAWIGIAILLGWFAFSTFYFGFALPNTFFAKLASAVSDEDTRAMAGYFWRTSLEVNWFTLAVIALAALAVPVLRACERALLLGVLLHLYYLDSIGGDFMQGRMLTVDFLICCFLLARVGGLLPGRRMRPAFVIVFGLFTLRFAALILPLGDFTIRTVMDERRYYYPVFGMLSEHRNWPGERQAVPPEERGRHVMLLCGFAGSVRMNAPDSVHVVDSCALTEPFLSRMASASMRDPRPGHFVRAVPQDYAEALAAGSAEWMPGGAGPLFADIMLISTAPLFDADRLRAIWRVNTTRSAVDPEPWRHPSRASVPMRVARGWLTPEAAAPDFALQPEILPIPSS